MSNDKLRVSGGSRRGRRLFSPPSNTIRPCSDMVRQALYNILRNHIEGSVFVDVFAGTGIVGIEALSRGAERALFVESDRRQMVLIRRNLEHVGFEKEGIVRGSDAFTWAKHFFPDDRPTIVFLGPPYPLFKSQADRLIDAIETVQRRLKPADILVLQSPKQFSRDQLPMEEQWEPGRQYGKTTLYFWHAPSAEPRGSLAGVGTTSAPGDDNAQGDGEGDNAESD